MGAPNLALVRYCRLVDTFMGAHLRKKRQKLYSHDGYSAGDKVSHSKIGAAVGEIVFFAQFADGMYALIDYGKRKRFERIDDLMPLRKDIYANEVGNGCESVG